MCKRLAGISGLLVLAAPIALSLLVSLASSSPARADGPYRAGVARVTVQDAVPFKTAPFEVLVAYPTDVPEAPFEAGPFTIHASLNAPIATAKAFPVLLFSHGNGRGGTPLSHRDLITSLARQRFIVIAQFHSGTRHPGISLCVDSLVKQATTYWRQAIPSPSSRPQACTRRLHTPSILLLTGGRRANGVRGSTIRASGAAAAGAVPGTTAFVFSNMLVIAA